MANSTIVKLVQNSSLPPRLKKGLSWMGQAEDVLWHVCLLKNWKTMKNVHYNIKIAVLSLMSASATINHWQSNIPHLS
jgi:hypothetical protein